MKRKVIQIANSTQLISLPRNWALNHSIKKGDELDVEQHGNRLVIFTEKGPDHSEIDLDITGLDRTSIMYYIRSAYRCGYETIKLKFNNPTCLHYRTGKQKNVVSVLHNEANRLVGMEIIQQKDNYCVIKAISEPTHKEFELLVRRIFRLTLDTCEDLLKIAKEGDMVLAETIEEKHDTITKFVSCCLRLLNQKGYPNYAEGFFVYHIIANIDNIVDIIKYCGRDLLSYKKKMNKESVKVLESINDSMKNFYDFYYKFDFEKIKQLSENRDSVKFRIKDMFGTKVPSEEIFILSSMEQILELILDLTEARASMNHCSIVQKTLG